MSIERVVTIFTPLFAAVSGLVTTGVAQLAPGVNLNKTDITALFAAGALAGLSAAIKWLHGRQKFVQVSSDVDKFADQVVAKVKANAVAGPALSDIEGVLKTHTAQIVDAIGSAVHAPPSAEEVANQIVGRLVSGSATSTPTAATTATSSPTGPGPVSA